ncbi:hypothetical protein K420107F6_25260 [Lactonifactor longoviformis]
MHYFPYIHTSLIGNYSKRQQRWAGEFRTIQMFKPKYVLGGDMVERLHGLTVTDNIFFL